MATMYWGSSFEVNILEGWEVGKLGLWRGLRNTFTFYEELTTLDLWTGLNLNNRNCKFDSPSPPALCSIFNYAVTKGSKGRVGRE